jgi:hypothetical protein
MWCTTDLHLRSHKHSTYRSSKHDLIDGLVATLEFIVDAIGFHHLNWNTFIASIRNMLAFTDPAYRKTPLGVEELRIEGRIVGAG